jgi:hypothetical protein
MAGAVASSNRQHRPAQELKRIPELLQKIDGYTGRPLTRWAIELTLLIFIRSIDLRFARWSERSILERQCGLFRLSESLFPA